MTQGDQYLSVDAPVSFEDTSIAFQDKSDRELFISFMIFWLTKSPFLVKFLSQSAKYAMVAGLPVKFLIKATVFKQFCGGESKSEYAGVIAKLAKAKIGTILDYAVEGGESETGQNSEGAPEREDDIGKGMRFGIFAAQDQ